MNAYAIPGIDRMVSKEQIATYVSRAWGVDVRELTRKRDVVMGRFVAMTLMRERGYRIEDIGRFFGLSHCSVVHGGKVVRDVIETKDRTYYSLVKRFL